MTVTKISPQLNPKKLPKQPPVGLGGWFAIIIIGLFGTIIVDILSSVQILQANPTNVNPYFLIFYIISIINEVFLSAVILIFIYKRNVIFRLLFLVQTCVIVLGSFTYIYLCYIFMLENDLNIMSILARILWTVYLFRSERVKNTFIGIKGIINARQDMMSYKN